MINLLEFSNYKSLFKSFLIKHGILSFVGRVLSIPLAVYFNTLLAKNLNTEEYGLIGLMISFITFSQIISMFGYKEILIKYLPFYFKNKKYSEFGSLIYTSFLTSIIVSFFILTIINIFSNEISNLYKNESFGIVIPFFSLNLFLTILCLNSNSILISLKKVWQSNFSERTIMNMANCIQLLLIYKLGISINLITVSIILINGKLMSLIFSLFYSSKYLRYTEFKNFSFLRNLKLSSHLLFSELSLKIAVTISPLIIGIFLNTKEVAFFYTAFLLANFTSFFISISNNLVSNKLSILFHAKNYEKILKINSKTSLYLGIFGIITFVVFIFLGRFILSFWGEQYVYNSYIILLILAFGEMINCFGGCSGVVITICNLEKKGLIIAYVSTILNLILQFSLIPNFGIIGAALSTSLSVIVYNILKLYIVYSGFKK